MSIAIYPYMNGSKSAKALKEELGATLLKREGLRRRVGLLINWGCSVLHREIHSERILNHPGHVGVAANKLSTFKIFAAHDVPTVEWTTDAFNAADWLKDGFDIVCRHKLSGHSGEGIEIITADRYAKEPVHLVAPLYTKYTKKKDEYRIHVFQGEVIFRQRKARKKDVPDEQVNWQVRNLAGGFIFAHQNLDVPAEVEQAAIAAVQALGLDFGAADIGFHKEGGAVVYEVNTACGLEGENLNSYVKAFQKIQ